MCHLLVHAHPKPLPEERHHPVAGTGGLGTHHPEQAQLCAVLPSPAPVGYWKPVTAGGPTGGRGQVPETLGKAEKVKIPSEAVAGAGSAGLSLVLV